MWLSLFLACRAGGEKPILLSTNCDKIVDVKSALILGDSQAYLTEQMVLGIAIAGDSPWARKETLLKKSFIFSYSAKWHKLSCTPNSAAVSGCSKPSCELSPAGVMRKVWSSESCFAQ